MPPLRVKCDQALLNEIDRVRKKFPGVWDVRDLMSGQSGKSSGSLYTGKAKSRLGRLEKAKQFTEFFGSAYEFGCKK